MKLRRKQPPPPPPLPRQITRYRNISESSGYIPYIYLQQEPEGKNNIIVVDEQQNSSAEE